MNSHKKQAEEEKSVSFQDHEDFYIRTSENNKTQPSERKKKVDTLPNTSLREMTSLLHTEPKVASNSNSQDSQRRIPPIDWNRQNLASNALNIVRENMVEDSRDEIDISD